MKIGSREIGPGHPPYVIAEIGVNHDGEVARALELTRAAAEAGADAVKLQYFETDRLLSKAAKLAAYQKAAGETDPVEMLRRLELSLDEMARVVDLAHELGIHAIVTVFSLELVKPASELAWDAYKSASPDVINRPLLEALAATGKPLIVSTGASTLDEVVRAVGWLEAIRERLAVLQCVSCYPAPEEALGGIGVIGEAVRVVTGYSDHTPDVESGRRAVESGASILEKHLTYCCAASGPDHRASLEPGPFSGYVGALPDRCEARGGGVAGAPGKRVLACERDVREVARQSLTTTRGLSPGETITRADLTVKRPGAGIEPFRLDEVIGQRLAQSVEADTPLVEDDLA
ncbi:MAG: N-acetylneuraminate synthase family protein [Phycisphaerales bacterium JB059]